MAEFQQRRFEGRFDGAPGEGPERGTMHEHGAAHEHDRTPWSGIEQECLDFCPICRTADVLRASVPPEAREQFHHLQHEALLTLKAILDHYIDRTDAVRKAAAKVEDIPID